MQRYKIVANLISGKCEPAIDPFGPLVRYEDAAEQVKKARREALEDAAMRLLDAMDSIGSRQDRHVVQGCISVIRQMEEEG